MINREDRAAELKQLLHTIDIICCRYDLRLGQLIQSVISRHPELDIFLLENEQLEELIIEDIKRDTTAKEQL